MPKPGQNAMPMIDAAMQQALPQGQPAGLPAIPPGLPAGLPPGGLPGGVPGAPADPLAALMGGGAPAGQPDPAVMIAAVQADQIYKNRHGQSFLEKQQMGQATPEDEIEFGQLLTRMMETGPTGEEEVGLNIPQDTLKL